MGGGVGGGGGWIGGGYRLGMNSKAGGWKGAVPKVIGIDPFAKMEKCDSIGG